jgi:hypothetical protein
MCRTFDKQVTKPSTRGSTPANKAIKDRGIVLSLLALPPGSPQECLPSKVGNGLRLSPSLPQASARLALGNCLPQASSELRCRIESS